MSSWNKDRHSQHLLAQSQIYRRFSDNCRLGLFLVYFPLNAGHNIQLPTMDEKRRPDISMMQRPHRRTRSSIAIFFLFLLGFYTYRQLLPAYTIVPPTLSDRLATEDLSTLAEKELHAVDAHTAKKLVPLEVHIISKCPDTRVC